METSLCLFILCIYLFGTGFSHLLYSLWGLQELEFTCFGEPIDFFFGFLLTLWVSQGKQ